MTTGMPELGSKISLISKADIRYEGRLFTVDPQECTIALASVRSFGTENREAQFPVPAQNQVYDYILFRGSDIKDIQIVNRNTHPQPNHHLNDPAIMQLSVPASLGAQPFQQHPILGHMAHPPYGSFMPMGGLNAAPGMQGGLGRPGSSAAGSSKPSELLISPIGGGPVEPVGVPPPPGAASIISPPPVGEPPRPNEHSDFIGGVASRSTTPASVGSRKSLSVDQGTQADNQHRNGNRRQMRPIQPPRGGQMPRNRSRDRRDSQNRQDNQEYGSLNYQNYGRPQRGRPQQHLQNHGGGYQYNNRGNNWNVNNQQQQQRGGNMGRGMRGGQTGRPKTGPFRPGPGGTPGQNQGNRKTLRFESEYDFEQANTEFEELRSKLAKVKLDEAAGGAPVEPSPSPSVNGAAPEIEKKDDSGNETGAGENEQEEDQEVFYDKTKSFFDKISCEAVERAKGKMQRTDWRQERKLNSETFGVAATRRGNFRGRGGYRGNYRNGGYRPGYNNRYPQQHQQQQRRSNDQQGAQQTQQEKEDSQTVHTPLSGEEVLEAQKNVDKQDETQEVQAEKIDEKKNVIVDVPQTDADEATVSATKLINESDSAVVAESSACLGQ